MGYARSGSYARGRRSSAPRAGRWMELRYAGVCAGGGEELEAGVRAFYDPSDRTVCCTDLGHAEVYGVTEEVWQGSPTGGGYVNRLAAVRVGGGNVVDPFARTRSRGYYGRDAGRCEDAPCCGCCS
jgi:hypothetical protein